MAWIVFTGLASLGGWFLPGSFSSPSIQDPEPFVHYEIQAELQDLDEGFRRDGSMAHPAVIAGTVTVEWRNPSSVAVPDMLWHVYNNAWASPDTVWLRESVLFGDPRLPRVYGGTQIQSVAVEQNGNWIPVAHDWVDPSDRTVLHLDLPSEVAPAAAVRIRVAFEATLAPAFRRSGSDGAGGYLHAVQWYPKPGVWEKRSGVWGWNCEPYHYLAEFYADFANWEVSLRLPNRYHEKVASTGSVVRVESQEDSFVIHWQATQVHDFAWTADPDFVVVEAGFHELLHRMGVRDASAEDRLFAQLTSHPDFAHIASVSDLLPKDLRITLMLQPEHAVYRDDYLEATVTALYWFGLWFGEYPYPTLAIIDPAHNARWTGGMEYPRLFTGGVRLGNAPRTLSPEGVTVHELGHQFWYGLVGNDEFHHAWLDEGFNTWSTSRVMAKGWEPSLATWSLLGRQFSGRPLFSLPTFAHHDPRSVLSQQRWALPDLGLISASQGDLRHATSVGDFFRQLPFLTAVPEVPRNALLGQRSAFRTPWSDPLSKPIFDLLENDMRRVNAYSRPALLLETFSRLMGEETMARVMRSYYQHWRYRHPKPEDFLAEVLAFADGTEIGGHPLDWTEFWLQAWANNDELDFGVHRILNRTAPKNAADEDQWQPLVEIRRIGSFRLPVEYRIYWSDGMTQNGVWDGQDPWLRLSLPTGIRKVDAVEVDPDRRLLLDANLMNNSLRADPDRRRALRWAFRAMLWSQQMLHAAGGTG